MKILRMIYSHIITFLTYFFLCAFTVTCSFLLFFRGIDIPRAQIEGAARVTFINILFLTVVFVAIDAVRRKLTVDRPVRKIKNALARITGGDFSVRLDTKHTYSNFADIMDSINRMTQELSGVETLKTDFIANVSHEMKTPLSVIQNYGTLLQSPDLTEQKRVEYAKAVTHGSRRLADMMTNILKLNRLENQRIYPPAEEYDLGEQLCECLLQYEKVWEEAQIKIGTEIAESITVKANAELLSLVWNNLFSNAFKFTDKGGSVLVSLTSEGNYAVVKVCDTGCGMSPEVGAHIFEKFYQGDNSHAVEGNGLGLALVKRIVDIIQGEISVESIKGKGSTFTVKIRRA